MAVARLLLLQIRQRGANGSQLLLHVGVGPREVVERPAERRRLGVLALGLGRLPRQLATQSLDLRLVHFGRRMKLRRPADDRELHLAVGRRLSG